MQDYSMECSASQPRSTLSEVFLSEGGLSLMFVLPTVVYIFLVAAMPSI